MSLEHSELISTNIIFFYFTICSLKLQDNVKLVLMMKITLSVVLIILFSFRSKTYYLEIRLKKKTKKKTLQWPQVPLQ